MSNYGVSCFVEYQCSFFARSVVIVTKSGYVKRLPIDEFDPQSRGGKGKAGTKLSTDEDSVMHFFVCNTLDSLLFVTDR